MKVLAGTLCGVGTLACLILASDSNRDGADDARLRLVVTQVPAEALEGTWSQASSLADRYPSGSRIVLVEPGADGQGLSRVLSQGLDAAGAPALSPLGDRVVFAGRRRPASAWCIFEAHLQRGRLSRRVEVPGGDCGDPAYLPQGEIVFVVTADGGADEAFGPGPVSYLARTTEEESGVQRITFGPGAATHPTVLHDGRVLFSMTTVASTGVRGAPEPALFTVNPDGTLLDPFSGVHDESGPELRARQTQDGRILFLSGPTASSPRMLAWVEFGRPMGRRTQLVPTVANAETESLSLPLVVGSATPLAGVGLVVTGRALGGPQADTFGVYSLASGDERAVLLFDDPGWDEVEAVPVGRSRPARSRPSSVLAGESTGTLVCYDAGYSDRVHGPREGAPAPAAVSVQTSARAAEGAGLASERMLEVAPGIVELGRVTVSADRSFFVRVPADVPLRVRSLDADLEPIATSGWFWIRPGETRACFGCHERRDTAPPNRIVQAIAQAPQECAATKSDSSQ